MVPEINYWAVIVATLSTMVVGTIWYTPKVFGNRWMKLAKVTPGSGSSAVVPILVTLVVSFISAWVLAGATTIAFHFYGGSYLVAALVTGILLCADSLARKTISSFCP